MKVSAVIPVYNGARFLPAALESVLGQTYPLHEIIIVDDGSTDSSPEILRSFGDRLTVIRQDNQGIAAARNAGLCRASGDFIAFLDHDDLWPRDRTRRMIEALQDRKDADVVMGSAEILYQRDVPPDPRENLATMHRPYLLGSMLVRARLFARLGEFNTDVGYADDSDFWFRRLEGGAVTVLIDEVSVIHRLHAHNTSSDIDESQQQFLAAIRESLRRRRAEQHED